MIAVPYPIPAGEFTLLVSDWYKNSHKVCNSKIMDHFTFSFTSIFFLELGCCKKQGKCGFAIQYDMLCCRSGLDLQASNLTCRMFINGTIGRSLYQEE